MGSTPGDIADKAADRSRRQRQHGRELMLRSRIWQALTKRRAQRKIARSQQRLQRQAASSEREAAQARDRARGVAERSREQAAEARRNTAHSR